MEVFSGWVVKPVWSAAVGRMLPSKGAAGAGLAEPLSLREWLEWRRGAGREIEESGIRHRVHTLTLRATEENPGLRWIGLELGRRIADAVTATLLAFDVVDMDLVQRAELNPARLASLLREAAPQARAGLPEDAPMAFFDALVLGACEQVVEEFTHRPEFTARTLVEMRRDLGGLVRADQTRRDEEEDAYRKDFAAAHGRLRSRDADRLGRPELEVLYVPLTLSLSDGDGGSHGGRRLEDLLRNNQRHLVVGRAGDGKSMLLRYTGMRLCETDSSPGPEARPDVPVLLDLGGHAASADFAPPDSGSMLSGELAVGRPRDFVQGLLRGGRALLLIDGLDDLPRDQRATAIDWLDELLVFYPRTRCVLTVQPGALDPAQLRLLSSRGFWVSHIEPLTSERIHELVERRHMARSGIDPQTAVRDAHRLVGQIEAVPGLARLATSPQLAATLCELGEMGDGGLPTGRSALFDYVVEKRLGAVEAPRGKGRDVLGLGRDLGERCLRHLALSMTLNGRRTMARKVAVDKLRRLLPPALGLDAATVLDGLRERTGLVQDGAPGLIEFCDPGFQDHLAAAEILPEDHLDFLVNHAHEPQCHDVFALTVGRHRADRAAMEKIFEALLCRAEREDASETARTLWLLAAVALDEAGATFPTCADRIIRRVLEVLDAEETTPVGELAKVGGRTLRLITDFVRQNPPTPGAAHALIRAVGTARADAVPLLAHLAGLSLPGVAEALLEGWSAADDPRLYAQEVLGRLGALRVRLTRHDPVRLQLLSGLRNLYGLDLSGTALVDAGALRGLTSLRWLCLAGTGVVDAGPIAELTGLRWLDLSGTGVADTRPLGSLSGLRLLNLGRTGVTDIGPLQGLSGLRCLYLGETGVTEIAAVRSMPELRELGIEHTGVDDLSPLIGLPSLRILDVTGGAVDRAEAERLLPGLDWLHGDDSEGSGT